MGSEFTEHFYLIHQDIYEKRTRNAIFLLIDPKLNIGDKMNIQAFQSRPFGIPGGTMGYQFFPLKVTLEFFDAERCAVDMMVSDSLNTDNQLSVVSLDLYST